MAKKRLVNKARQPFLVPIFDTKDSKYKMVPMGYQEFIEVEDSQLSPQVQRLLLRGEFKLVDIPTKTPKVIEKKADA